MYVYIHIYIYMCKGTLGKGTVQKVGVRYASLGSKPRCLPKRGQKNAPLWSPPREGNLPCRSDRDGLARGRTSF